MQLHIKSKCSVKFIQYFTISVRVISHEWFASHNIEHVTELKEFLCANNISQPDKIQITSFH